MKNVAEVLLPPWIKLLHRKWLVGDLIAGVILAAIAIPEVMGYASIAKIPVSAGLYTLILPVIVFAAIGASRFLTIGGDAAVAALVAAGLGGAAISGVTPGSTQWLAYTCIIALICGALLTLAAIFRVGFIADFFSVPVITGLRAGVGVLIILGMIPEILGVLPGKGSFLEAQWSVINSIPSTNLLDLAYAGGSIVVLFLLPRLIPKFPAALAVIVVSIILSTTLNSAASGVAVVGEIPGGLPSFGLPQGLDLDAVRANAGLLTYIALLCAVLLLTSGAVASRSYAQKAGDPLDLNRDILGIGGSNFAAGLTGTMPTGGSLPKTLIMVSAGGRSQIANLAMAGVTIIFLLAFTSALQNMPKAVLAAIVLVIACRLITINGFRQILARSKVEFVGAVNTMILICVFGILIGLTVAIVASTIYTIKRLYRAKSYIISLNSADVPTYVEAQPGLQSEPGLIIFRFPTMVFYANANRFMDQVRELVKQAPDPVEWFIVDASAVDDLDYSSGVMLNTFIKFMKDNGIKLVIARRDAMLSEAILKQRLDEYVPDEDVWASLPEAYAAFQARPRTPV